ncbi:hypothetical protein Trydic_g21408 [Trypoxylus dichotomus]
MPIGLPSEEAQENIHEDYKYYRLHFTRKRSRTTTNENVFHKMLESLDPYMTQLRSEPKKKHFPISEEHLVLMLLQYTRLSLTNNVRSTTELSLLYYHHIRTTEVKVDANDANRFNAFRLCIENTNGEPGATTAPSLRYLREPRS